MNVKFSNSQLNKLRPGISNGSQVSLKISSNVVGDSNDENNFPRKHKAFGNNTLANIKLSKTQLHKIAKKWIAFNTK